MKNSLNDRLKLNNGTMMPLFGLGVFKCSEEEATSSVKWALEAGYRCIDTASQYKNEQGVGKGIRQSGVPREEIFITTKLWNADQWSIDGGETPVIEAFEESLKNLGTEYIDLYLIHWPCPANERYVGTWKVLEKLYKDGRIHAIGISNFNRAHIENLLYKCEVVPAVNQIEYHPYLVQTELLEYCRSVGIQVESWSPIARGLALEDPNLLAIAKKYGKNVVQLVLRWQLQRGIVVIPKSVNRERIIMNSQIFDFEISEKDMLAIESLNQNKRIGPDPDLYNNVRYLN